MFEQVLIALTYVNGALLKKYFVEYGCLKHVGMIMFKNKNLFKH